MVNHCTTCQKNCNFSVLHVYEIDDTDELPVEYRFAYCEKCKQVAVFKKELVFAESDDEDYDFYRVYPENERGINFLLPPLVRESYEEAILCEQGNAWIATVTMVGRALEAVCKDACPQSTSIFKGLENMHQQGLISDELLEWSNELRVLRNLGAHATDDNISELDAKESLDFLQAILEILYHLRPKFKKMKSRRNMCST